MKLWLVRHGMYSPDESRAPEPGGAELDWLPPAVISQAAHQSRNLANELATAAIAADVSFDAIVTARQPESIATAHTLGTSLWPPERFYDKTIFGTQYIQTDELNEPKLLFEAASARTETFDELRVRVKGMLGTLTSRGANVLCICGPNALRALQVEIDPSLEYPEPGFSGYIEPVEITEAAANT